MSARPDVLVVGAGHNGLVAALRLARAGRRVLVVEGHERPGGLSRGEEFHPGYRVPGLLHDEGLVPAEVVTSLGLDRHGLALREAPAVYLAAGGNGDGLLLDRDPERAAPALTRVSAADAAAYREWRRYLGRVGGFVRDLLGRVPPPIAPAAAGDFWTLGRLGLGLRRLGRRDMTELLRVAPMCVADWLNERFATPWLVEALAAPAVAATFMGPWSAGTAGLLLLRECAAGHHLAGGPAALVAALVAAGRERGVELRTGARVERIRVAGGRVAGVRLASGEEIDAPVVAASCDPRRTFLELLPLGAVETRFERQIENFRARGTTAKVHLALSGPLEVAGADGGSPDRMIPEALRLGGGTVDHLERAFDAVKYRSFSPAPFLDVRVPTVADPRLAPAGHHVVSILASFAPHDLEGGWTDARREELGDAVVAALARHAPDVTGRIVAREVLTPADLAARYALTGGHVHHGEHALDQLFAMRPVPRAARYATPIPGLFLAGSGSHPGGGVTGLPGWLAAGVILKST